MMFFRVLGERDAAASGEPIVLRFGFEMNGDWFSWSQRPAAFKKAYKRAYSNVS